MNVELEKSIKLHIKDHEDKMHPHGISRIFNKSSDDTFDCSMDVKELFNIDKAIKPKIIKVQAPTPLHKINLK